MASELAWILGGYSVVVSMACAMLWRRMYDAECELEWVSEERDTWKHAYYKEN